MSRRPDIPLDVILEVGERYSLRLGSRATAGYRWHVSVDGAAVEVSRSREADPAAPPGASGADLFEIHALAPGVAVVTLELRRPWEAEVTPHEVRAVSVRVRSTDGP